MNKKKQIKSLLHSPKIQHISGKICRITSNVSEYIGTAYQMNVDFIFIVNRSYILA